MAGGSSAILTLKILADAKDAISGLKETGSAADRFHSGVKSAAVPAAAALGALGAAGLVAAKAAAEDAAAADQLALALRNSAGASDASIAATEDWITKTSKAAAVADDELRPALATLVRATGDVATSQDAMGVALDISAATGKDVESVSTALAKAYGGQTAGLRKLVPGLDAATLASGDMDAIMAELARTTGGAAAKAANSAAGQMKGMEIQMGEAQETIGGALLPALSGMAKLLASVATWVQKNTTLFLVIAGVVAAFATTILALNVALKVYNVVQGIMAANTARATAGQWALNAAFLANPITWVVIGIVALIAAIVLIATKTTWFQDIWEAAWGAITRVATAAWKWISNAAQIAWQLIITGLKLYIGIYVAIFNGVVTAVKAIWNWVADAARAAFQLIRSILSAYVQMWIAIFNGLRAAVGGIWEGIKSAAQTALAAILAPINAVRSALERVVDAVRSVIEWLGRIRVPDVLGKIGGMLSNLNPFSAAASVSAGTRSAVSPTGARLFSASSLATSRASAGGPVVNVYVPESSDPVATARYLRKLLARGQSAGVVFGAV